MKNCRRACALDIFKKSQAFRLKHYGRPVTGRSLNKTSFLIKNLKYDLSYFFSSSLYEFCSSLYSNCSCLCCVSSILSSPRDSAIDCWNIPFCCSNASILSTRSERTFSEMASSWVRCSTSAESMLAVRFDLFGLYTS